MRRLILAAAACLAMTGAAAAQETEGARTEAPVSLEDMLAAAPAEDEAVIRRRLAERYVELTEGEGFAELMETMSEGVMSLMPDMPANEQAWFRRNLPLEMTAFGEMLIAQMIPLVAEAMTVEELEALIAFYETPLGRSIATKQMQMGAQMGVMMEFAQIEFQMQFLQKYCEAFDCTGRGADVARPT